MDTIFLETIYKKFQCQETLMCVTEITSGHINDTYLIETGGSEKYILQRINDTVFKDVIALQENKIKITQIIKEYIHKNKLTYDTVSYVPTIDGEYYYKDLNSKYWNVMKYVKESITIDRATDDKQVYEAAKLFGHFSLATATIATTEINEILPDFHNMNLRYKQFEEAMLIATDDRKEQAAKWITSVKKKKEEMTQLTNMMSKKELPLRVTHNDTKLSNILFNEQGKGKCVIDLDTIMPGIIHFDFGDAVRSICSTAVEDEEDVNKIRFNLKYYQSFCKGFASVLKTELTLLEKQTLILGVKTMLHIMGLRFLTDFLNNDNYYKIEYPIHNLVRAKNQFILLEDVEKNLLSIQEITQKAFEI